MQLSDIVSDQRKIVAHLSQGDLNITYRPSGYTAEVESQVMDGLSARPVGTLCTILAPMLIDWDLMDGENGFPVREDALGRLPAGFLIAVLQAIMEDMRPNPTRSAS